MEGHGQLDLRFGVFAVALQVLGQMHFRHGLPRQPLVPQQRQNRMVEGRRRQLDLAAIGQLAMQRNHLLQAVPSAWPAATAFRLRSSCAPCCETQPDPCPTRMRSDGSRSGSTSICRSRMSRLLNRLRRPLGRIDRQAALQIQLVVARIGADHLVRMDHEEVVEQIVHVRLVRARRPATRETRKCVSSWPKSV